MKVAVSGTRNGEDWPGKGGEIEMPDHEGADLCASGIAEPVVDNKVETAVAPESEKRSAGRKRG
jgi:hypothetical protein